MKVQGQTGSKKTIQLPSAILSAGWLAPSAAAGGEVGLEVMTQFVADGSPVRITGYTVSGSKWQSFEGKVFGDVHRRRVTIPADAKEDLFFLAELPDHKLDRRAPNLQVTPLLRIAQTRWLDPQGKDCTSFQDGVAIVGKARLEGILSNGDLVKVRILVVDAARETCLAQDLCPLKDGWVELPFDMAYGERADAQGAWKDRERHSQGYVNPSLVLEASREGVTARGAVLAIRQELELHYEEAPGKAGRFEGKTISVIAPDGTRTDHTIPADGLIKVSQTLPGLYSVDNSGLEKEGKAAPKDGAGKNAEGGGVAGASVAKAGVL